MNNFLLPGIISLTAIASPLVSLGVPSIAATLEGTFDWQTTNQPTTSLGNTIFTFDDNNVDQGTIVFNVIAGVGSGVLFPFGIDSVSFTQDSSLEVLTFSDSDGNNGILNFINDSGAIDFNNEVSEIAISNLEISVVPEPLTILGAGTALAFGTTFKRKLGKAKNR